MKRYIILNMFCLLALTNVAARNTTYIIEPIMIGTNHFEQDPGKRHAPPRQVILSVEQEENVFIILTSLTDNIAIYLTDSTNEILYASQSMPNNGEIQIIVPSNIAEATTKIILKVNNKTYIGHKQ